MPTAPRLIQLWAIVTVVTSSACADMLNPDTTAEPAVIIALGDTARIVAPDTVARDTPFAVRFSTFGGGCVREVARTDVLVAGSTVEIRPFNERVNSNVCTDDLRRIEHVASVRISTAGIATLRVIGEQLGRTNGAPNARAELVRTIVVR